MNLVTVTLEYDGTVDTFKVRPISIRREKGHLGTQCTMRTESGIEVNISKELFDVINKTLYD